MPATQQARAKPVDYGYSEVILSSPTEILELNGTAESLLVGKKGTLQPAFFLATVSKVWIPRVVVISQAGTPIGIVYAKERKVARLPTGIIYGDATLGGMIVAERVHQEFVLGAAVKALFAAPGVRALRILAPVDGFEQNTIRTALSSAPADICQCCVQNHVAVTLPSSYDEFVERFGPRTRRNLRYYRHRSAAARHIYVEDVSLQVFEAAAYSLLKQGVIGADMDGVNRALNMFRQVDRPFLAGLRDDCGEWVSIFGGWYDSNRLIVFLQMNSDKKHARASLSLVMRSYVIESLIRRRITTILFWAGVGGPIGDAAKPVPTMALHIDSTKAGWRAFRRTVSSVSHRLPAQLAFMAEWIAVPAVIEGVSQTAEVAAPDQLISP